MTKKKLIRSFALSWMLIAATACGGSNPTSFTCASPAAVQNQITDIASSEESAKVSMIVKVRDANVDGSELESVLRSAAIEGGSATGQSVAQAQLLGGQVKITRVNDEVLAVELPNTFPTIGALIKHAASGKILYIEPDYPTFKVGTSSSYSDPSLASQWAHQTINTYTAWDSQKGSSNIIVAVIDTGIDYSHEDLQASMWKNPKEKLNGLDDDANGFIDDIYGWNFANNTNETMANDTPEFHGTHVAGTIAASLGNGKGGAGVAPGVKLMAVKYLDQYGIGKSSDAIRAIDYAVKMGAKILNNSWGSISNSSLLADAIERARLAGVLVVAAAGNGDGNGNGVNIDKTPFYPASYTNGNMISVAASDVNDKLTQWSNFGAKTVSVVAPGMSILSTRNGNAYAYLSGTSMATPATSGVLGLIWSANPKLSYAQVKSILMSTVDPIAAAKTTILSAGRINAARAVAAAMATVGTAPSSPSSPSSPVSGQTASSGSCQ